MRVPSDRDRTDLRKRRGSFLFCVASASFLAAQLLTSCATAPAASPGQLYQTALKTSCDNPIILRIESERPSAVEALEAAETNTLDPETGVPITLTRGQLWRVKEDVRVSALGYGGVPPERAGAMCNKAGVTAYALTPEAAEFAVGKLERNEQAVDDPPEAISAPYLYVRHMTSAEIDTDPSITCKPNYSQVYQPPLTLSGSGRVINVVNGERCE